MGLHGWPRASCTSILSDPSNLQREQPGGAGSCLAGGHSRTGRCLNLGLSCPRALSPLRDLCHSGAGWPLRPTGPSQPRTCCSHLPALAPLSALPQDPLLRPWGPCWPLTSRTALRLGLEQLHAAVGTPVGEYAPAVRLKTPPSRAQGPGTLRGDPRFVAGPIPAPGYPGTTQRSVSLRPCVPDVGSARSLLGLPLAPSSPPHPAFVWNGVCWRSMGCWCWGFGGTLLMSSLPSLPDLLGTLGLCEPGRGAPAVCPRRPLPQRARPAPARQ